MILICKKNYETGEYEEHLYSLRRVSKMYKVYRDNGNASAIWESEQDYFAKGAVEVISVANFQLVLEYPSSFFDWFENIQDVKDFFRLIKGEVLEIDGEEKDLFLYCVASDSLGVITDFTVQDTCH